MFLSIIFSIFTSRQTHQNNGNKKININQNRIKENDRNKSETKARFIETSRQKTMINQFDQLIQKLKRVTNIVKYAPFVIAVIYIVYYIWAGSADDNIAYFVFGNLHLPIYATLGLSYLSYRLNFCWWHLSLCLMPLAIDLLLFGAEFEFMDWANDITYTNIIIGLISWLVATTFICYKYGCTKK